ncbi:MAG: hypothetical protein Q8P61_00160 [Candidatus Nanopelagicales bacterium]|nr:hypothetical protein [Candidatus Nanopelagicales bacterium]
MEELGHRETIIPAASGWYVIGLAQDISKKLPQLPKPEDIWKTPIIAWVVKTECECDKYGLTEIRWCEPLAAEVCSKEPVILSPDGQVMIPEDCSFDSIELWLQNEIDKFNEREEVKAA